MLPRLPAIVAADIGYAWLTDSILWLGTAIAITVVVTLVIRRGGNRRSRAV